MDELFWDEARGGYFNSAAGDPSIVLRLREDYDGAEPAASSVAAMNLLRLGGMWHDETRSARGRKTIEATDIFDALSSHDGLFVDVLRNMGANPEAVMDIVRAQVQKRDLEDEQNRKKFELPPYLKHFGVSLNRLARADKIPPTIGREKEIQQIIEILCHRERANSPMLVGEPGVGKTAVIEGLARLVELEPEKVPARLRGCHIVQLQMGGIVAGTMLRVMFE